MILTHRRATGQRLSRARFGHRLLRVAARLAFGSHQVKVILSAGHTDVCSGLWQQIEPAYPIRG